MGSKAAKNKKMPTKGFVVWLTGLSGAGKSAIAERVYRKLSKQNWAVEMLDGDVLRNSISQGLGYSKKDRAIHLERVGLICEMLSRNRIGVVAALVSPYRQDRNKIRSRVGSFVEVYVDTPLSVCEGRDVKGLYRLARQGKIENFTGVSDSYEPPQAPELVLRGVLPKSQIDKLADQVIDYLKKNKYLK